MRSVATALRLLRKLRRMRWFSPSSSILVNFFDTLKIRIAEAIRILLGAIVYSVTLRRRITTVSAAPAISATADTVRTVSPVGTTSGVSGVLGVSGVSTVSL